MTLHIKNWDTGVVLKNDVILADSDVHALPFVLMSDVSAAYRVTINTPASLTAIDMIAGDYNTVSLGTIAIVHVIPLSSEYASLAAAAALLGIATTSLS